MDLAVWLNIDWLKFIDSLQRSYCRKLMRLKNIWLESLQSTIDIFFSRNWFQVSDQYRNRAWANSTKTFIAKTCFSTKYHKINFSFIVDSFMKQIFCLNGNSQWERISNTIIIQESVGVIRINNSSNSNANCLSTSVSPLSRKKS